MPEKKILLDWHSDGWWMHVCDEALTPEEEYLWEQHLSNCENCRLEWAAIQRLDLLLQSPPALPSLSPDFASRTLTQISKQQRLRRILSFIAGSVIVAAVSLGFYVLLQNFYSIADQYLRVIFSARYILISSTVQIVLGLIEEWRMLLPFFVGSTILIFMLLMPNSALVTFALVWYSRRQQKNAVAI